MGKNIKIVLFASSDKTLFYFGFFARKIGTKL